MCVFVCNDLCVFESESDEEEGEEEENDEKEEAEEECGTKTGWLRYALLAGWGVCVFLL